MYKTLVAPLAVHVEVETDCNQKCVHCYNFWRDSQVTKRISLDKSLAIRVADELAKSKVFHVILNGGEPMENFENLLFFMGELSRRGISFSLNSNLTMMSKGKARALRAAGLRGVLTSLLSHEAETHDKLTHLHGSFSRIQKGIENSVGAGLSVSVNMVVTKANLSDVEKAGRYVKGLGAFAFSATRVASPRSSPKSLSGIELDYTDVVSIVKQMGSLVEVGLKLDSLIPYPTCFFNERRLLELFSSRSCSAGKTSLAIGADGSVRACPHYEVNYGSIFQESLGSIWARMQEWRDGRLLHEKCVSCRALSMCGGGCRMEAGRDLKGLDSIAKPEKLDLALLSEPKIKISLNEETMLRVRSCLRFRNDNGMGIVNIGGTENVLVTSDTLTLLETLHGERTVFTPRSIRISHGVGQQENGYLEFLQGLVKRKVLEVLNGGDSK